LFPNKLAILDLIYLLLSRIPSSSVSNLCLRSDRISHFVVCALLPRHVYVAQKPQLCKIRHRGHRHPPQCRKKSMARDLTPVPSYAFPSSRDWRARQFMVLFVASVLMDLRKCVSVSIFTEGPLFWCLLVLTLIALGAVTVTIFCHVRDHVYTCFRFGMFLLFYISTHYWVACELCFDIVEAFATAFVERLAFFGWLFSLAPKFWSQPPHRGLLASTLEDTRRAGLP
jgi:hypothetical protein